jgi:hypothetical protein
MGLWLISVNHWNVIQIPYGHNLQTPYSKLTAVNFLVGVDDMGINYTNILTWGNGLKQEVTYAIGSNISNFNGKLHQLLLSHYFLKKIHMKAIGSHRHVFTPLNVKSSSISSPLKLRCCFVYHKVSIRKFYHLPTQCILVFCNRDKCYK